MPRSPFQLDHLVLLLPHTDIVRPPEWLTRQFAISPGGRHADGRTENRLIYFRDGTYLELIGFVDDDASHRRGHHFDHADRKFGLVDFALTGDAPFDHVGLAQRLSASGSGVSYSEASDGGRTTHDGQIVRWRTSFPRQAEQSTLPFWCLDVTPRRRRVAATNANTNHPCGAVGVSSLTLLVPDNEFDRTRSALSAIVNNRWHDGDEIEIATPLDIGRLRSPTIRLKRQSRDGSKEQRLSLVLQTPRRSGQTAIEGTAGDEAVRICFES